MSTITAKTRQMSFDDIQDKTKIRYIQILNGKKLHRTTLVRVRRYGNG